jgi:hypothetical protein
LGGAEQKGGCLGDQFRQRGDRQPEPASSGSRPGGGSKFNVSRTAVFVFRNRVSFFIFRVLVFQP